MLHDLLKKLGLSEKEAAVYLAMLQTGPAPASAIASRGHQNRGTTYNLLKTLVAKGFAEEMTDAKVLRFVPVEPQELTAVLERKKQELETSAQVLQTLLTTYQKTATQKPRVHLMQGTATIAHHFPKEKPHQLVGAYGKKTPLVPGSKLNKYPGTGTILLGKEAVLFLRPDETGILIRDRMVADDMQTAFRAVLSGT